MTIAMAIRDWLCSKLGHKRVDTVRRGWKLKAGLDQGVYAVGLAEESAKCERCGIVLLQPRVRQLQPAHLHVLTEATRAELERTGISWDR